MRVKFRLKLLGRGPMTAKSISVIVRRAADVCDYIGQAGDLESRVVVRRVKSGSLEILYWLYYHAEHGNAVAWLALELISADILAAFAVMRLATGPDGSPRQLPGPAASAMADVLDAVEEDHAIKGWSVRAGSGIARRSRAELFELRGALGGPKEIDFRHKIHVQVQQQFPGFPTPSWQITWEDSLGWQTARVAAPNDGVTAVAPFDKLVVDLEIHELIAKGSRAAREVFIRKVYWGE